MRTSWVDPNANVAASGHARQAMQGAKDDGPIKLFGHSCVAGAFCKFAKLDDAVNNFRKGNGVIRPPTLSSSEF